MTNFTSNTYQMKRKIITFNIHSGMWHIPSVYILGIF